MRSITDGITGLRNFKNRFVNYGLIARLTSNIKSNFFIIMYVFIFSAVLNIIILILSPTPDFKELINIGERGTLFLVAIAGLTFTYGDAVETSKKKGIIKTGEYFFNSFLTFVIGMIFSIGFRKATINPINTFSLPEDVFFLTNSLMFLLLTIALAIIITSAYFFATGMTGLLESFRQE